MDAKLCDSMLLVIGYCIEGMIWYDMSGNGCQDVFPGIMQNTKRIIFSSLTFGIHNTYAHPSIPATPLNMLTSVYPCYQMTTSPTSTNLPGPPSTRGSVKFEFLTTNAAAAPLICNKMQFEMFGLRWITAMRVVEICSNLSVLELPTM